jgi:hypothetical protein
MSEQFACASGANYGRPLLTPFFSPPLSPVITFLWGDNYFRVFFSEKKKIHLFLEKNEKCLELLDLERKFIERERERKFILKFEDFFHNLSKINCLLKTSQQTKSLRCQR